MSNVPTNFICPITYDIMKHPVLLVEDGHSYERSALEQWLKDHNTSPITNQILENKTFVINYNLQAAIEEYSNIQDEKKFKEYFQSFGLHRGRLRDPLWKNYPKLQIIISLLGASTVGKSCLAANIEYGQTQSNYRPRVTLAVDVYFFYLDRLFEDEYVVVVQVNDCPGTDRFEAVSDRHFRNCHGAVLMVDTTNIDSFNRMEDYWYKRLREKSSFDNVETVLACNKIDLLETYDSNHRDEFFARANQFVSRSQIPMFNISAIRGDNIQAMFHRLISSILENPILIQDLKDNAIQPDKRPSAIHLETHLRNKKSSSCNC